MIECVCNNIRTRHVEEALAVPPEKTTPGQIYKAAAILAGAEIPKMKCANCTCRFEEFASHHNADKGVERIKRELEIAVPTAPAPKVPAL